jgi:hypothetical protein
MRVPAQYEGLLAGEVVAPSTLVAQLPEGVECPGVTDILERVERAPFEVLEAHPVGGCIDEGARWQMELRVRFAAPSLTVAPSGEPGGDEADEGIEALRLWALPSEAVEAFHLEGAQLTAEERAAAGASPWSLWLATDLRRGRPLIDFHRQLSVLTAVAPEAALVYDVSACRAHGGAWLQR